MQKNGNLALLKCRSKCWSNHPSGSLHRKVVPWSLPDPALKKNPISQKQAKHSGAYDVKRDGYAGTRDVELTI